jgi:hypothetical protein
LLDSYEIERVPVCQRVIDEAMKELSRLRGSRGLPEIELATPEGEKLRAQVSERLKSEFTGSRVWHRWGIHLGYLCDPSPIIVPDGTPRPVDDTYDYAPTARPGSRAPHFWLAPGKSVLDLFGRDHVLLCFGDAATETAALRDAARSRGLPLAIEVIDDPKAARLYERKLVLVRPDGYVAWRGDTVRDALEIIDQIRGAAPRHDAEVARSA